MDSADYKCKIVNAGIGVRHEALKKVRDAIKKTKKKLMARRRANLSQNKKRNKPKLAYSCNLADMDYHRLSWTIINYHGTGIYCSSFHTIYLLKMVYHGLSWTIMDYHGLS